MKFTEIPIYDAIYDVYTNCENQNLEPRSTKWLISKNKRQLLVNEITSKLSPESKKELGLIVSDEEEILTAWEHFGKRAYSKKQAGLKLTIEIIRKFGAKCSYAGRLGNKCNDTVSVDRMDAGGEYSLKNCIICCQACNSKRGPKPIDQAIRNTK